MINSEILNQLIADKDVLYDQLSATALSDFFAEEYESISGGETVVLSDDEDEMLTELDRLRKDKSFDALFADKVNLVNIINEPVIINGFMQSWKNVLEIVLSKGVQTNAQAAFVRYDAYDLPKSNSLVLYVNNAWPEFSIPKYLPYGVYKNEILTIQDVFDFTDAWPDCEAFDWTTEHLDVYFYLLNLFRLNARILLHKALAEIDRKGYLSTLKIRPFYFYIAEHDMEVSMLYKL